MNLKCLSVCTALALAAAVSACSHSATAPTQSSSSTTASSSATSTTSAAGASGTVTTGGTATTGGTVTTSGITITTPALVTPTDGQQFKYTDQPLTLTIKDAAATGSGTITYTFQVASDAGFTTVVATQDGVAETSGQTSTKITTTLAGPATYFWRARANSGGTPGLFSKGRTFSVGPQVIIQAPAPTSPANGGQASGAQPTLTVNNAAHTGPAGALTYEFQIADSSSFSNVLGSATVAEGSGQTSATINVNLNANATYYWRALAIDATNGVTSPFSAVWSFKYVPFDMHQAIIMNSPYDLADWAQTANITSIVFTPDAFLVDFDKRDGPNRWPDTPFGSGTLEYTLGMCLNINGQCTARPSCNSGTAATCRRRRRLGMSRRRGSTTRPDGARWLAINRRTARPSASSSAPATAGTTPPAMPPT